MLSDDLLTTMIRWVPTEIIKQGAHFELKYLLQDLREEMTSQADKLKNDQREIESLQRSNDELHVQLQRSQESGELIGIQQELALKHSQWSQEQSKNLSHQRVLNMKTQEVSRLNSALEESQTIINTTAAELRQSQAEVDHLRSLVRQNQTEIRNLQFNLTHNQNQLSQAHGKLSASHNQLEYTKSQLVNAHAEHESVREQLQTSQEKHSATQNDLSKTMTHLTNKTREFHSLSYNFQSTSAELINSLDGLSYLKAEVARLNQYISVYHTPHNPIKHGALKLYRFDLLITSPDLSVELLTLTSSYIKIGRSRFNSLVLNDPAVSSFHCRIYENKRHLIVEDLNSSNGTFVNELQIEKATRLKPNMIIKVIDYQISVSFSKDV